jgi:hypothetical protein
MAVAKRPGGVAGGGAALGAATTARSIKTLKSPSGMAVNG